MKQLLRGRSGRKNTAHATLKSGYKPYNPGSKISEVKFIPVKTSFPDPSRSK